MKYKGINLKRPLVTASILASAIVLAACGSSSSSDTSSSTPAANTSVSKGIITGFGSVFVNGIEFETDSSEFSVDDDDTLTEDDLRVGMVVTVNGDINADGTTGIASLISYNDDLEGPISAITVVDVTTKIITVLGRQVTVNADTVFDDDFGLSFDTLAVNDVVEVSGLVTAGGIIATHIEKQGTFDSANPGSSKIEIVGTISNLSGSTFDIDGLSIDASNAELDDITALQDGLFVEVKGALDATGTILIATKVEGEDEGLGDEVDEAEVEGIISDYNAIDGSFKVQGQIVDASTATLSPADLQLDNGITVEAEGSITNGVLVATKVKLKGQKIKIEAAISDIQAETISFNFNGTDIIVRVNQQTEFEDERDDLENLSLTDLTIGDFVEIKAFYDGTDTINAVELELKDSDTVKIKGPVDSFDAANSIVTLFGIAFDLTTATFNNFDDAGAFFAALSDDQFIKLSDSEPVDGIIDEVEIDD